MRDRNRADLELAALLLARRSRLRRVHARRKAGVAALAAVVLLAVVLAGAAASGRAVLLDTCSLNALQPVGLGQNSFLYADNGTLLGVVPSSVYRQPLRLDQISPLPAHRDGRDRGSPLLGARRARLPGHRARALFGRDRGQDRPGRVDDHAGARSQPVHREREPHVLAQDQGGLPCHQARAGVDEAADPERVPQRGVLRPGGARRAGGGRDVLLDAGAGPLARAVGAARRSAAGAHGLRPAPAPGDRDAAPRRGAERDARQSGDHDR